MTDSTPGVCSETIDASCRWPLLGLYFGSAFWLVLSAVAYLVASMSFHAPAMFADCAGLSYGRMAPVAGNLLIYGFCIPAGWAAALWMLARLGKTKLVNGVCVMIGAKLWSIGVLIGTIGILAGGSSGYEHMEFPLYSAWPLLLGSVLIGVSGLNTLRARTTSEMHPVQWFAGLAVLWFPWIYITAVALLQLWPVRGMAQGAVHWWYLAQLQTVLLGLLGVGSLFYFLPILKQQSLASRQIAFFALITLVLCGGWTGVPLTAAVPAWMSAIGRIASVWLLLPVLAVVISLWSLGRGRGTVETRFFQFGFLALLIWTALVLVQNATGFWKTTAWTLTQTGLNQLFLQGFSLMIGLGAAYYILPRITGGNLTWPGLVKLHFWLGVVGILLVVIPFVAGGVAQGQKLANAHLAFTEVAATTLMPIRVGSMGQLLLVLGSLLLFANVTAAMARLVFSCLKSFNNAPVIGLSVSEGEA